MPKSQGVKGTKMISITLAKKLKVAGLKWKPKIGDRFWDEKLKRKMLLYVSALEFAHGIARFSKDEKMWLPSLLDLIKEIEKRVHKKDWHIEHSEHKEVGYCVSTCYEKEWKGCVCDKNLENVVGKALLKILKTC